MVVEPNALLPLVELCVGQRSQTAPVDPFVAATCRMVRVAGGVVFYSVGPDGEDDGGRGIRFSRLNDPTGDIVFFLEDLGGRSTRSGEGIDGN